MGTCHHQNNSVKISYESLILIVLCILDMVVTLWLIQSRSAVEGNPILRFYLELGLSAFIGAKLLLSLGPIAVLEGLRRRRPQFVQALLRVGIVLYLVVYCMGILHLNVVN